MTGVTVCSQEIIQRRDDTQQNTKPKRPFYVEEQIEGSMEGETLKHGKRMPRKEVKGIKKQKRKRALGVEGNEEHHGLQQIQIQVFTPFSAFFFNGAHPNWG